MPNVEVHGLGIRFGDKLRKRVRDEIFNAIRETSVELAADTVVTVIADECLNIGFTSCPFLRVIAEESEEDKISKIVKCLEPLGYDIEILAIKKFIQGKKIK